jgi:hypothetical protein
MRANEVVSVKVGDIDSTRMVIRVEQGEWRKDRHRMLSPNFAGAAGRLLAGGAAPGLVVPQGNAPIWSGKCRDINEIADIRCHAVPQWLA